MLRRSQWNQSHVVRVGLYGPPKRNAVREYNRTSLAREIFRRFGPDIHISKVRNELAKMGFWLSTSCIETARKHVIEREIS